MTDRERTPKQEIQHWLLDNRLNDIVISNPNDKKRVYVSDAIRAYYREKIKKVGIEIILEEMGITNIVYTETPEGEAKEYTIKDVANAILKEIDKEMR